MLLNIFIPLFNFILISIFGRYLGKIGTIYITLYCLFLILILNLKLFCMLLLTDNNYYIYIGTWLDFSLLNINWEFLLDSLAACMLIMVSLISIIVHLYSFDYMKTDPHFIRFMSYLSLFTFFMFLLVTANTFIQLFLGWEGVGLCSYLLINFWYTRIQANKAAIKALLMNKVGDISFLFAATAIFIVFKTFDFTILITLVPVFYELMPIIFHTPLLVFNAIDIICFSLLIGVIGKSAQIGLHTWLPAAMEGPTPVSALIHAATMVTAGVFLIIRTSFFFEYSTYIQNIIIILGSLTALLSAFTAIFLYDIKKIIAYSTCSQLGYMVLAAGLSQYTISFFHLINHAFFKALLFLTAGAIIHSFNNEQDIRKLGGLFFRMPFLYSAILIGNIAILGIPFLSGFYSKDLIIEISYIKANALFSLIYINCNFIYIIILIATCCTTIYSLRLYYFLFLRQNIIEITWKNVKSMQQPFYIQLTIIMIILSSIFIGYYLNDLFTLTNYFFKYNNYFFNQYILYINYIYLENEFIPYYIKLAPLICNLSMLVLVYLFLFHYNHYKFPQPIYLLLASLSIFYKQKITIIFKYLNIYLYLNIKILKYRQIVQNNFYFNEIYNYFIILNFHYYYKNIFLNVDKGILELVGPTGIAKIYFLIAKYIVYFFKQNLTSHLFVIYNVILVYIFIIEIFL